MAKILIAEDSPTTVAVLSKALSQLGHTIITAADGVEAERRIRQESPDLIILDIIMPKMNGYQLCREVRADPKLRSLPIIVVTSMDRESDRFWGLKQGADEYLTKPVDPDELMRKVKRFLDHTN